MGDPGKMGRKQPKPTGRDGSTSDSSVYKQAGQGKSGGPSGPRFRGNMQHVSQQTHVARGQDPAHRKPEGVWQTRIGEKKKKE
jgi:hypothetical protein